ncbi:MAG TPA: class I adenylate-forming enzyme family protein [Myxococcota bacterium]|nr:class I adenylate-forming enzyme family protein [Myxococcota bacterium]
MSSKFEATAFPDSLAERVRELARTRPDDPAYLVDDRVLDWVGYDAAADRLARVLLGIGLEAGDCVAVWLPDGPGFHIAYQATERAGLVTLGLGARCGERELAHLLRQSGARTLLSAESMGGTSAREMVASLRRAGIPLEHHLIVERDAFVEDAIELDDRPAPRASASALEGRGLSASAISLYNTTSGTTGLPKIVVHDQLRWLHFNRFAVDVGHLRPDDVFMSVLPAPSGFGLWTGHVTPTLLGVPTVLLRRFDANAAIEALLRHRVSVLAAVSTQFILMLETGRLEREGLALRTLFTGGEAVPERRARSFEERTGAFVLQFYGSNETGAVSATRPEDPPTKRLTTAGRPLPEMNLRLFDAEGRDVTASGQGRPGVKGPVLARGYLNAPEATAELIRPDGWMLLGDWVELDADGYLRVVGRTDDIIIRGGKNLSAAAIEEGVAGHPAVALVAAIGIPDAVFGERAAAYVELRPGTSLDLETLKTHLAATGIARELWPEALVVLDALPHNVGGKVAKSALREDALARFGADDEDAVHRARAARRPSDDA